MGRRDLPVHAQGPARAAARQVCAPAQEGQVDDRLSDFRFLESGLDLIPFFGNTLPYPRRWGRQGFSMQYFVVMIDYGRRGREAVVDPEVTRREVISRVASGEYQNICFIHEIAESSVEDVTEAILTEAALPQVPPEDIDLQAILLDHARDLRKHEKA